MKISELKTMSIKSQATTSKFCNGCGFILPLSTIYFHEISKEKDGFSPYCKKCIKQKKLYKDFKLQKAEVDFEAWLKAKDNKFKNLQESVRYFLGYNPEGFLYWKKPKYASKMNVPIGSSNPNGYLSMKFNRKTMRVHRCVWVWHHGDIPKHLEIDHINGNRKDNRIENLRMVTHQQNQTNMTKAKGFYRSETLGKWYAQITDMGKHRSLGTYDSSTDARVAYLEAKKELMI